MSEPIEPIVYYYYFSDKGQRLYTPNLKLAAIRAEHYGTFEVYRIIQEPNIVIT